MAVASGTIVFCDGACSGNPGPGGWGAIVVEADDSVRELGGRSPSTTNNRMELAAAIAALNFLKGHSQPITVYTDSVYVIRGITQWVFGWQKRNWTNSEGADVANRELWEELMTATRGRKVSWQYVRGHVGIVGNERADKIAVQETAGDHVELYAGPLSGYGLDIRQVPDDTSVPEMRSSAGKPKKALAYFSFVDGKVRRHTDWSSCERLVKGRSGAKFKKVMTEAEADELLAQWGFSASDVSV